jgi:hypothetical protein
MAMTALKKYALRGSISYGELTETRLKEILLGADPIGAEKPRLEQAIFETTPLWLDDLAEELSISYDTLEERIRSLFGKGLPS